MTIAAIPTLYNGLQFRSRLEARWAAMFDLCGFRYDYEPADFDGYIPDFRIGDIFLEIKPGMIFDPLAAAKIGTAIAAGSGRQYGFLLQECPSLFHPLPFARRIGWSVTADDPTNEDRAYPLLLIPLTSRAPCFRIIVLLGLDFMDGDLDHVAIYDGREIDSAWRKASNATQWRGAQVQE